jgi:hypothetical protein
MNWLKSYGDKLCTFVSLASLGLQAVDANAVPSWVLRGALVGGIIATAAHQSFFPSNGRAPA